MTYSENNNGPRNPEEHHESLAPSPISNHQHAHTARYDLIQFRTETGSPTDLNICIINKLVVHTIGVRVHL